MKMIKCVVLFLATALPADVRKGFVFPVKFPCLILRGYASHDEA